MSKDHMKIGIVSPYNLSMPGGVQQHIFAQAAELRKRGHKVKIITPKPRGKLFIDDPDVIFVGISARIKTPQHTSADISISVTTDDIDRMLEAEQFDVIHVHEPFIPMLARQMLPRVSCPVLATFHAAMPETFLAKSIAGSVAPFIRSVIKHLNAYTAVSDAATSYIGQYIDTKDIYMVPNGVDLKQYHTPVKEDKPRHDILYVGRLEKRKGVKFLIEAFALLHQTMPATKLTIVGGGPDKEKLEKQVAELGIKKFVRFAGYASDAAKQKMLREAALFVSPALYGESFGIVLVEAMASGTPIVAGNNPGYASVLADRGSISLVDPEDTEAFAQRMELLLTDEKLRKLWIDWAVQDVKKYAYKNIVDQYEKIYKDLIA